MSHVVSAQDSKGLRSQLPQGVVHGAAPGVGCHDEVQLDGRAAEVRAGEYVREKREDWLVEGGTVGSKAEDIPSMHLLAQ